MLSEKENLLRELKDTWCKLGQSSVAGIGVFAIKDIPQGTHPFSMGKEDWLDVAPEELKDVAPEVMELIKKYCTFENGFYNIPKYGFKVWDMVDFLNHSKEPNVASLEHGEDFVTTKAIKQGEELFIDYATITQDAAEHH